MLQPGGRRVKPHPTWIMIIVMLIGAGFLWWDLNRALVLRNVISDVMLILVAGVVGCLWARGNEEL